MAEVRKTQPLQQRLAIVDPNTGQPSDYFMKYIALHGGAITDVDALVLELQAQLGAKADKVTQINTGTGLDGGGNLSANRTIILKDTAVTPGTYGSSTKSPVITVDQQGRLTAVTEATISGGGGGGGGGGLWGGTIVKPTLSSTGLSVLTGGCESGAAATDGANGIYSNNKYTWLSKTAPSTPYTITACIQSIRSIGFTDGTRSFNLFHNSDGRILVGAKNAWNSWNTDLDGQGGFGYMGGAPTWLRVSDDGTYLKFYYSLNGGESFTLLHTRARASGFLTSFDPLVELTTDGVLYSWVVT